jgi:hypothetical protein
MDNVTFTETELYGQITEHATIDKGNGEFETMTKEEYQRRQAEHFTPSVINETSTK